MTFQICPACPGEDIVATVDLDAAVGSSPLYGLRHAVSGSSLSNGAVLVALRAPFIGGGDRTTDHQKVSAARAPGPSSDALRDV